MTDPKTTQLPPAVYVNFLQVAQRQSEFFLAFGQVPQHQEAAAHLLSSFVTTPAHAKSMCEALADAVRRYEERFGPIAAQDMTPSGEGPASRAPGSAPRRGEKGRAPRGRAKSA